MTPELWLGLAIGVVGITVQASLRLWFAQRKIRRLNLCEREHLGAIEALDRTNDKLRDANDRLRDELAWARTLPAYEQSMAERRQRANDYARASAQSQRSQLEAVNQMIAEGRQGAIAAAQRQRLDGYNQLAAAQPSPTFAPLGTPVRHPGRMGGGSVAETAGFPPGKGGSRP